MSRSGPFSRRAMLRLSAFGAGGLWLASCQGAPPPPADPKVVERVVTQIVEKPVQVQVEKVVTQVVERVSTQVVQVMVTPTSGPEPLAKVGPELLHPQPEGGTVV